MQETLQYEQHKRIIMVKINLALFTQILIAYIVTYHPVN